MPSRVDMVFKITPRAAWDDALPTGVYAGSADDVRDGFIHLSTAEQIDGTLARHFAGQRDLIIVAFDAAALGDALTWEASRGGALFPHVYATLSTQNALWTRDVRTDETGRAIVEMDFSAC